MGAFAFQQYILPFQYIVQPSFNFYSWICLKITGTINLNVISCQIQIISIRKSIILLYTEQLNSIYLLFEIVVNVSKYNRLKH